MNLDHPLRRGADPISPANERIHDAARLLLADIAVADHLGLDIISAELHAEGRTVLVAHTPACAALGGRITASIEGANYMQATRFGTVIRWFEPLEVA